MSPLTPDSVLPNLLIAATTSSFPFWRLFIPELIAPRFVANAIDGLLNIELIDLEPFSISDKSRTGLIVGWLSIPESITSEILEIAFVNPVFAFSPTW